MYIKFKIHNRKKKNKQKKTMDHCSVGSKNLVQTGVMP